MERLGTDTSYRVRNIDAGQSSAVLERLVTDSNYRVRNDDAFQPRAPIERKHTDSSYLVGGSIVGNGSWDDNRS